LSENTKIPLIYYVFIFFIMKIYKILGTSSQMMALVAMIVVVRRGDSSSKGLPEWFSSMTTQRQPS
jgi:hypothetical protein